MNLNTNTYTIPIDNTSRNIQLSPDDANQSSLVISNESTKSVFVVSQRATAKTAVFPTGSALPGKVILPGAIVSWKKNVGDDFISAIQGTTGVGNLYIAVGSGT